MKHAFHPALRSAACALCILAGTSSAASAETLESTLARTRGIIVAPSEQRLASLDARSLGSNGTFNAAQSSVAITSGLADAVLPSVQQETVRAAAESPFRTPLLLLGGLSAVVLATFGLMLTLKAFREDQRRRKLAYRQQFLAGRNGTLLNPR